MLLLLLLEPCPAGKGRCRGVRSPQQAGHAAAAAPVCHVPQKAQALLGQMLIQGYGCKADPDKGREWVEKARRRGYRMQVGWGAVGWGGCGGQRTTHRCVQRCCRWQGCWARGVAAGCGFSTMYCVHTGILLRHLVRAGCVLRDLSRSADGPDSVLWHKRGRMGEKPPCRPRTAWAGSGARPAPVWGGWASLVGPW